MVCSPWVSLSICLVFPDNRHDIIKPAVHAPCRKVAGKDKQGVIGCRSLKRTLEVEKVSQLRIGLRFGHDSCLPEFGADFQRGRPDGSW